MRVPPRTLSGSLFLKVLKHSNGLELQNAIKIAIPSNYLFQFDNFSYSRRSSFGWVESGPCSKCVGQCGTVALVIH